MLVIEDDEMIRELMDLILTQAGFRVVLAGSGEAGLDLLQRLRVAIVLLDVHMPRMDGLQVLEAMRRMRRAVPVLMVTADRSSDTVGAAGALGVSGYMAKPFTAEALLMRVRRALAPPAPAAGYTADGPDGFVDI
ncbi:response regulator [Brevundimonas sp.]|uniref:response regulator transcription factor n=1 Tax=Brevundimonas sp. TaxID=1871086 RepID=UPI002603A023|nr:response regulator [Brevundimonas sp.]